jgi:tetratricopeptide (TPR) repeat protein/MFS family permease
MATSGDTPNPTQTPDAFTAPALEPAMPDRILLPPPAVAPPETPPRQQRSWLDYLLVAVVLGFAFLAGSFPAHNSDLWLHLATGRDLAAGKVHFGVDPYSQGAQGVYWVNTHWLYDLITYAVFQGFGGIEGRGGSALILLKALMATLLAVVMLRLGWRRGGLWASAVGAALAVLALSPWLAPHPMIVSYLFLALTLYFLERPHTSRPDEENGEWAAKPISFIAYWPLLPLFILWVNLDSWFLLGPLTVALVLLGQVLQANYGPSRDDPEAFRLGETAALVQVLAACLAVCLINPFGVYAFLTPPAQLGLFPAMSVLQHDSAFRGLLMSPFEADYLRPGLGWSAAGLAYYSLALLSGLSFVVNLAGLRWRRLLVWSALLLLSAFQVRAIPFFAVAAGPILALNVRDFFGRRVISWRNSGEASRWALAGRLASLLAGLTLLGTGWPGLLHSPFGESPRWDVELDAGLQGVAEKIHEWRKDGLLGADDQGFNLSADAANYFAWFCPQEKGVIDARLPLFSAAAAADFVTMRKQLSVVPDDVTPEKFMAEILAPENDADPSSFGGASMEEVRKILRARNANHLVIYDNDKKTALLWVQRLMQYPAEWPLLDLEGHTAVFGWRDLKEPDKRDAFASLAINLKALAFQDPQNHPQAADTIAPSTWPGREPAAPDWVDARFKAPRPRSPKSDEAALYLVRFDEEAPQFSYRAKLAWNESLFAGAVGAACCSNGSIVAPYEMTLRLNVLTAGASAPPPGGEPYKPTPVEQLAYHFREDYGAHQPSGPESLLYLALRAARQAVHDNPDDAQAYLILGKTYRRILQNTTERTWNPPEALWHRPPTPRPPAFQLLYRVRTAEAVTAYKHALVVNPDLEEAHVDLISLYQDMNYQDEVLAELKEVLRCNRKAGRKAGEDQKDYAARILDLEDLTAKKEKDTTDLLDKFEVRSAGMPVYTKADTAWHDFGLAGKALSILLSSDVASFGPEGMAMELELLLHTGRVKDVRDWPNPEDAKDFLGPAVYLEIQVQLDAALGNYQSAEDDLEEMIEEVHAMVDPQVGRLPMRTLMSIAAARTMLLAQPQDGYQPLLFRTTFFYPTLMQNGMKMVANLHRQADLTTLRGILALEYGGIDQARKDFHDALMLWGSEAAVDTGAGINFPARPLAQDCQKLLDKAAAGR